MKRVKETASGYWYEIQSRNLPYPVIEEDKAEEATVRPSPFYEIDLLVGDPGDRTIFKIAAFMHHSGVQENGPSNPG